MFIQFKSVISALALASLMALTACASQAPRIKNASLGFAVTNFVIDADSDEQALSNALGTALNDFGVATAMPAKADIEIQNVRYDTLFLGFFYGGKHYASLDVTLTDGSGRTITDFPLYVAANGSRTSADADLAAAAARIIAAKAANAFMPMQMAANNTLRPKVKAQISNPEPNETVEPQDDRVPSDVDSELPCVIGPDGKCLPL